MVLKARDTTFNKTAFQVILSSTDTAYRVKVEGQDNSGNTYATKWFRIGDSPSTIEVRWNSTIGQFRSGGTFSGFSILINGTLKENIIGILNNQIKIDEVDFGAQVASPNLGTSGEFYLDDFSLQGPSYLRSNQ